jgi:hypothetical protein
VRSELGIAVRQAFMHADASQFGWLSEMYARLDCSTFMFGNVLDAHLGSGGVETVCDGYVIFVSLFLVRLGQVPTISLLSLPFFFIRLRHRPGSPSLLVYCGVFQSSGVSEAYTLGSHCFCILGSW